MNRFMLDTDLSIYVLNRRSRQALDTFNAYAGEICISAITLAELLHGAEKSGNPSGTRRRVEDFTSRLNVLEYGERAATSPSVQVHGTRWRTLRLLDGSEPLRLHG